MLEFLGFGVILAVIYAIYEIRKHGVTQAQILTDLKRDVTGLLLRIESVIKK